MRKNIGQLNDVLIYVPMASREQARLLVSNKECVANAFGVYKNLRVVEVSGLNQSMHDEQGTANREIVAKHLV